MGRFSFAHFPSLAVPLSRLCTCAQRALAFSLFSSPSLSLFLSFSLLPSILPRDSARFGSAQRRRDRPPSAAVGAALLPLRPATQLLQRAQAAPPHPSKAGASSCSRFSPSRSGMVDSPFPSLLLFPTAPSSPPRAVTTFAPHLDHGATAAPFLDARGRFLPNRLHYRHKTHSQALPSISRFAPRAIAALRRPRLSRHRGLVEPASRSDVDSGHPLLPFQARDRELARTPPTSPLRPAW